MIAMGKADNRRCVVLVLLGNFDQKTVVDPVGALLMVRRSTKEINYCDLSLAD